MQSGGRRGVPVLILALVALTVGPGAGRARSPAEEILAAQPPGLTERLLDRRVVLLQEFGKGPEAFGGYLYALVVFSEPRTQVMDLLVQTSRQIEFRPDLSKVDVVEESPDSNVNQYRIQIMLMKVEYRLRHEWDFAEGRITWSLDPRFDNDVRQLEGFWEFFEFDDGRTLGRFGTKVDVGPGLPTFLQDYATRKKLPEAMENTRRWVDSRGEFRP